MAAPVHQGSAWTPGLPACCAASCLYQSTFTRPKLEAYSWTWPLTKKKKENSKRSFNDTTSLMPWPLLFFAIGLWEMLKKSYSTLNYENLFIARYYEMNAYLNLQGPSRLDLVVKHVDAWGCAIILNKTDNNPKAEPNRLRRSGWVWVSSGSPKLWGQPPRWSQCLCFASLTRLSIIFNFRYAHTTYNQMAVNTLHVPPSVPSTT